MNFDDIDFKNMYEGDRPEDMPVTKMPPKAWTEGNKIAVGCAGLIVCALTFPQIESLYAAKADLQIARAELTEAKMKISNLSYDLNRGEVTTAQLRNKIQEDAVRIQSLTDELNQLKNKKSQQSKPAPTKSTAKAPVKKTDKPVSNGLNGKYQFYDVNGIYIGATPHGDKTLILYFKGNQARPFHRTGYYYEGFNVYKSADGDKVYTDQANAKSVTVLQYNNKSFMRK